MEVEFEFLLEDNHYRVFRRRDKAARAGRGKTVLDLQVYGPLGWRSMGEESIRLTEKRIVELLRMDYNTFINSAFLLQGRADEFTIKPPAERKRILAEILGLSYYDTLEQRAREHVRAEDRNVQALSYLLEDLDRQLTQREELEQALASAQAAVDRHEEEVAHWQQDLSHLQKQVAALEATARQAEDLRQRLVQIEDEIAPLQERLSQQEQRLQSDRELLEREEEIESEYAQLQSLREQNEKMAQAAGRLLKLSERQRELERVIANARNEFVTEREVQGRALADIEHRLEEKPAIEKRLAELRQALSDLGEKETQRNEISGQAQEKTTEIRTIKAECQRLRKEMEQLKEKLVLLEESATHCPLCQSPLGEEEMDNIRATYQLEGEEKRDLYREQENRIHELEGHLAALKSEQEAIERELKRSRPLERQLATLEKDLESLDQLIQEQGARKERLRNIDRVLEEASYAPQEKAELAELQKQVAQLYYDHKEHQQLQQELSQLRPIEEAHRRLHTTRQQIEGEARRLEDLRANLQRRQQDAADARERLRDIETQITDLPRLVEQRREAENALITAREALGQTRQSLGAAQRELEHLEEVQQTWKHKQQEHQEALERRDTYEEIGSALGKRGVQAMLIETAVPEIEREANELLQRMTGGEMTLQLAMQRATKGGSVTETLDINISDINGMRPYDSYSGGERFRINFALRIALSRLLARRAGASLQTLVIDEGFGTQDAEGREKIVEAINSIQDEFEKILVITHIQELKEMFPARIEVQKTPEGSSWTVL
jgi:exonuclease SbcC